MPQDGTRLRKVSGNSSIVEIAVKEVTGPLKSRFLSLPKAWCINQIARFELSLFGWHASCTSRFGMAQSTETVGIGLRDRFAKLRAGNSTRVKGDVQNMRKAIIMLASLSLLAVAAMAQESRSEISLQGTGFFTKDTSGDNTVQRVTNTGGFLVGYRYNLTRWLAAETVYGYDRNSQHYFGNSGLSRVQANVHQATGGFVFRVPTPVRFIARPYVLAEGGALVFDPTGNPFGTVGGAQRQSIGTFAYGGGVDFPLFKYAALRAEYRGLVYNAPDFGLATLNTNGITHTAEPSAGIVLRF
jgi:opacity protein-like surface antigen